MQCLSTVSFLGIRSNVSRKNGKTYYNVDVRSDGRNMSFGTKVPEMFKDFREFQPILITLDLFSWNNSLVGNIVNVQDAMVEK